MVLTKEAKSELMSKYRLHEKDTGSVDVQIAVLTERINYLTEHLKYHKKDHHTRLGLLRLVRKRQRLLSYLNREDSQRYQKLIADMGIRR
jgi:small subunit ribosomal protein S15